MLTRLVESDQLTVAFGEDFDDGIPWGVFLDYINRDPASRWAFAAAPSSDSNAVSSCCQNSWSDGEGSGTIFWCIKPPAFGRIPREHKGVVVQYKHRLTKFYCDRGRDMHGVVSTIDEMNHFKGLSSFVNRFVYPIM